MNIKHALLRFVAWVLLSVIMPLMKWLAPKPEPEPEIKPDSSSPTSEPAPIEPPKFVYSDKPEQRRVILVSAGGSSDGHLGASAHHEGQQLASSSPVRFVSRHGFTEYGVSCPVCRSLAAKPAEWDKVHLSEVHGEGVACVCGVMLFAAPDDDKDPVKPGEKYDESVYHRFVRPEHWSAKRHRVVVRSAVLGDWVTIRHQIPALVTTTPDATLGTMQDLDGGEGRVVKVEGGRVQLALAGNTGIGGSGEIGGAWVWLKQYAIHPMALPSIATGDLVRISRGVYKGSTGTVTSMTRGVIAVKLDERHLLSGSTEANVRVEFIEKTEQTTLI